MSQLNEFKGKVATIMKGGESAREKAVREQEERERAFHVKHLSQLIGLTVVGIVRDGGDCVTEEMFGLQFNSGKIAWIQCDPEGNGRGHLAIEKGAK